MTIYLHGGGFAYSNPPLERIMAYRLSQVTGRPAFAVDYRLAPAHPFPAAIEDVVAAYRSFLSQDVPAGRILLAGESAGATLLLSTLLVLAQAGDPLPAGAVALSPVTDFAANHWATPSDQGCDPADPVGDQYLAGARPDQAPQSPLYGDLRGLPPILLAVGGDEILLHDARRFAEAATTAGVDITLDIYDHMPHAFQATVVSPDACHLPTATTFLQRVGEWVARFPAAPAVR
ncbi:virginiamycin B lyase [Thermocatellispora tengchongensis]|uniref:Virginiamycin B lyase n=1 Tax=Thermocatellispora tengchongensis TaxID=1073253 RepID=A0A840PAM8_9ACTN|nr:virginiamycin B lyase [Thermocatellispora tengchongensis]